MIFIYKNIKYLYFKITLESFAKQNLWVIRNIMVITANQNKMYKYKWIYLNIRQNENELHEQFKSQQVKKIMKLAVGN